MSRYDYSTYDAYLNSGEWREIRSKAIRESDGCCCLCGSTDGLQVHHLNYNNMDEPELIVLCSECHHKVHRILNEVNGKIESRDRILLQKDVEAYRDSIARIFADAINQEWPQGIIPPSNKNHFCAQIRYMYISFFDSYAKGPFIFYDTGYNVARSSIIPGADKISHYLIKQNKRKQYASI